MTTVSNANPNRWSFSQCLEFLLPKHRWNCEILYKENTHARPLTWSRNDSTARSLYAKIPDLLQNTMYKFWWHLPTIIRSPGRGRAMEKFSSPSAFTPRSGGNEFSTSSPHIRWIELRISPTLWKYSTWIVCCRMTTILTQWHRWSRRLRPCCHLRTPVLLDSTIWSDCHSSLWSFRQLRAGSLQYLDHHEQHFNIAQSW